jgi:ATP-binding cassette, subfamily B, multidrug efflux pump
MMGGPDGARRLMERDVIKPKNVSATLARFWPYFRQRWYALILVAILMVIATWTQVEGPNLIGQAVDCYIVQENPFAALIAANGGTNGPNLQSTRNCWFDSTDFSTLSPDQANEARQSGLLRLVGVLVVIFVVGSLIQGVMFSSCHGRGSTLYARFGLVFFAMCIGFHSVIMPKMNLATL